MSEKGTFTINFRGQEFEIPKSRVEFQNGYGVVNERLYYSKGLNQALDVYAIGVVNEEYDTVLPIQNCNPMFPCEKVVRINQIRSYPKLIRIFPEGNIIVRMRNEYLDEVNYDNWHYKVIGKKARLLEQLKYSNYDVVDNTIIKVYNDSDTEEEKQIYDVLKRKKIL